MTEQEFLEIVANESWACHYDSAWGDHAGCVYCFRTANLSNFELETFELASQRIEHKEACPVVYAREKLANMESK